MPGQACSHKAFRASFTLATALCRTPVDAQKARGPPHKMVYGGSLALSVAIPLRAALVCHRVQQVIHHLCRSGRGALDGVGIDFGGGGRIRMAQIARHRCQRNAIGDLQRGVCVAQTVQMNGWQVSALNEAVKPVGQSVRPHGLPFQGGKHIGAVTPGAPQLHALPGLPGLIRLQGKHGALRCLDDPPGTGGLGVVLKQAFVR